MGRYGLIQAHVYDSGLDRQYLDVSDNLTETPTARGIVYPVKAMSKRTYKRVGTGSIWVTPDDYTAMFPLLQVGHIINCFQADAVANALVEFLYVAEFIIQKMEIDVTDRIRGPLIKISGSELTFELTQYPVYQDVGNAVASTTTVRTTAAVGQDWVCVEDSTGFDDGDAIQIGGLFDNIIYRGIQDGAADTSSCDGGAGDSIPLNPPLYAAITSGDIAGTTYITASNYSDPTTSDISLLIGFADNWAADIEVGTGTEDGTSHVGNTDSVLDKLNDTAEITGEFWRMEYADSAANAPLRSLEWRRTNDSSGIHLVMPAQADAPSRVSDNSYGIIEKFIREYNDKRVSHLIAVGGGIGDGQLSLANATTAASAGFTLSIDPGGRFAALVDTSVDTALDPVNRWRVVHFPGIVPGGSGADDIATAGNQLLAAAEEWMTKNEEKERFYRVRCIVPQSLSIGQTIELTYSDSLFTIAKTGANALYITEIQINVEDDGVRTSALVLSENMKARVAGTQQITNSINMINRNLSSITAPAITYGFGTSGGEGATHNPVSIASSTPTGGLAVDGNQALTLDITAGDGLSFSGSVVSLDAPGTLTAATSNAVTTDSHTHAITTTADAETTPSTILAGDANGRLRLDGLGIGVAPTGQELRVDGNLTFVGAQTISSTSGNINIAPFSGRVVVNNKIATTVGDLSLLPITGTVAIDADINLTTTHRTIQTTAGNLTIDATGSVYINTAASAILTPDVNVVLRPGSDNVYIDNTLIFDAAGSITTLSGDLTIAPANDLILDPANSIVSFPTDVDPQVAGAVSGLLGAYWQIDSELGHADFRSIYADELRVALFSADETLVTAGSHWVSPGMARIDKDVVIPAVSGTVDIHFVDSDALGAAAVFAENDFVMIRTQDTTGGGLQLAMVWGQVTGYTDNADGTQHWTWTTRSLGAAVGTPTVYEGAIALGFGASGDGWWNVTTNDDDGPYAQIVTWTTNPYTVANRDYHVRLGKLDGLSLTDIGTDEWGLAVGTDMSSADDDAKYLIASNQQLTLNNVDLIISDGTYDVISLTSSGAVKYGTDISADATTTFQFSVDGNVILGRSGGAGLVWNNTAVTKKLAITNSSGNGVIEFDADGNSYFAGIMTIDTSGEIRQGTGTWTTDFDGIRIWNSSGVGNFSCYENDTEYVSLNQYGMNLVSRNVPSWVRSGATSLDWKTDALSGTLESSIGGWHQGAGAGVTNYLDIVCNQYGHASNYEAKITLASTATSGAIVLDTDIVRLKRAGGGDTTLVIDQGANDGKVLSIKSLDFTDHTAQGMADDEYFYIKKYNADDAGALVKGAGDASRGLLLMGSCQVANSTIGTTGLAPIILRAQIDNTTVGATNNVVAMRDNLTTLWILQQDGDVHIDGTQNTYDYLDSDVEMVRAQSLLSPDAIRTRFDDMVRYNRKDLEAANLVNGSFVNTSGMMRLHSGAIWQLYRELQELREKVRGLEA